MGKPQNERQRVGLWIEDLTNQDTFIKIQTPSDQSQVVLILLIGWSAVLGSMAPPDIL